MKRFVKILLVIFLAAVIIVGSFGAGMVFYAKFFGPALAASPATALTFPAAMGLDDQIEMTADDVPAEFATFWEAWDFLNKNFYGDIPPDNERVYGAIRGMVASFGDQHTGFIDPIRSAVFTEDLSTSINQISPGT